MDIFPFARDFADNLASANIQNQTKAAILAAMADALNLGLHTCSLSIILDAGMDITNVLQVLHDQGFGASITGSTLTVTW